jgi:hypothetical protein
MKEEQAKQDRKKNKIKNIGLCALYVILAIVVTVLVYKIVYKLIHKKKVDMDGIIKNKIDELPEDMSETSDAEDSDDDNDDDSIADDAEDTTKAVNDKDKSINTRTNESFTGGSNDKPSGELLDTRLMKPPMITSSEMDDIEKSFEPSVKPSPKHKPKPKSSPKPKQKNKNKTPLKRDARGRFIARKK